MHFFCNGIDFKLTQGSLFPIEPYTEVFLKGNIWVEEGNSGPNPETSGKFLPSFLCRKCVLKHVQGIAEGPSTGLGWHLWVQSLSTKEQPLTAISGTVG